MKGAEDEAFDEIARKQGHWGGGFMAKRAMAADKLQEPEREALKLALNEITKVPTLTHGCLVKLADVDAVIDKALAQPPQRTWVGLTDAERQEIALEVPMDAVCITEAKLKEKNS